VHFKCANVSVDVASSLLSAVVEEDLCECTLERRSIRFITSFVALRFWPDRKD